MILDIWTQALLETLGIGASKMAEQEKVLATKHGKLSSINPRNPQHRRREIIPSSCPLTSTHMYKINE